MPARVRYSLSKSQNAIAPGAKSPTGLEGSTERFGMNACSESAH
jgi:hypothetical protein